MFQEIPAFAGMNEKAKSIIPALRFASAGMTILGNALTVKNTSFVIPDALHYEVVQCWSGT